MPERELKSVNVTITGDSSIDPAISEVKLIHLTDEEEKYRIRFLRRGSSHSSYIDFVGAAHSEMILAQLHDPMSSWDIHRLKQCLIDNQLASQPVLTEILATRTPAAPTPDLDLTGFFAYLQNIESTKPSLFKTPGSADSTPLQRTLELPSLPVANKITGETCYETKSSAENKAFAALAQSMSAPTSTITKLSSDQYDALRTCIGNDVNDPVTYPDDVTVLLNFLSEERRNQVKALIDPHIKIKSIKEGTQGLRIQKKALITFLNTQLADEEEKIPTSPRKN